MGFHYNSPFCGQLGEGGMCRKTTSFFNPSRIGVNQQEESTQRTLNRRRRRRRRRSSNMNSRKKITKEDEDTSKKKMKINNKDEIFSSSSFSSLGLHPTLCDQLRERMGFEAPTLVQAQAIPVILSGRHALVNAETGSGKTVAYLAPIIHHLQKYDPRIDRSDGTFALVLVPTRELCLQVYEILQKLLHRFHWIVPGYVMGGESRGKEKARLRKGISILVATPGRLLDHLKNTSSFMHKNLRSIIFDEADRILELGFGKDIEEILDLLGSMKDGSNSEEENAVSRFSEFPRQNLLLSATLNEKVNHLAQMSLENPVMIGLDDKKIRPNPLLGQLGSVRSDMNDESEHPGNIVSSNGDYKLPAQLVQRYVEVPCGSRLMVLLSILKSLFEREAAQKVVVFFSTRDAVDFHYSLLSAFKWPPNSELEAKVSQLFLSCKTFRLHGSMKPEDRRNTFQAFKTEKLALLLSTDVSARGLDFPEVRCIIQYDSPGEATEYVHRVGRTARMGEKGNSLLFLQPIEMEYLQELKKHGVLLEPYPLLKVLDTFPLYNQKHRMKKFVSIESHPWVLSLQRALEYFVITEANMKKLAKDAFCSWVRAYTAHRGELKRIFMVKKLHLGHVARSFALKEEPSLVGRSFQMQSKKRKRDQKQKGTSKRKKVAKKT